MRLFHLSRFLPVTCALFLILSVNIFAQQGTTDASVSRTRAITKSNPQPVNRGNSGSGNTNYYAPPVNFKLPEEVAVEEFVNYRKHLLPLPKVGQAVALDTRWGNDEVSSAQPEAVLQIGFTTAEVSERNDLRPVNLALVIDKSGSMADNDKMTRVKESLRTFIGKLRPDDIVSIVVFDTTAEVLCPANRIGDGSALRRTIDEIEPDGSTNLHGGLMLGYQEALKNFRKDTTNRVILLTDGIANVGTVEPSKIAAESSEFNAQGLDLSTIGVGLDLNNELLRTLATRGRGLYHFVSDNQDIEKVFVSEVQSLMSQVAKKVEVSVDYDPNLQIEKIYGYAPRLRTNGFSIGLNDMNNGLTQVVMMRFRARSPLKSLSSVKVRLSYFDVQRKRAVEEVQEVKLIPAERKSNELLIDPEVKKNYTIAELAQSLFEMRENAGQQKYRQAENILNASLAKTYARFPNMEDKDVQFVLNIVEGYKNDLKAVNQSRRGDNLR